MDIYSSDSGSGKSRVKKLEHFFRMVFLISSSALVVTIAIAVLDKAGVLIKVIDRIGPILLVVWFGSFALWIIFLIAGSRVGRFIGKLISQASAKKKKAGLVFLYIWLASVALFAFSVVLISRFYASFDSNIIVGLMVVLFFAVIFILPVWGFLLGNRLVKILVVIPAGLVVMLFVVYLFILRPNKVVGRSMTPRFIQGEYMFSEKVTYYFNSPKRGDVVVFHPPTAKSEDFFARIVGLPGENIAIRAERIFIDNKALSEPYLQPGVDTNPGPFLGESNVLIPKDEYVMLGDDRSNSNDSRHYGFVKKSKIESRIFYIYWPPDKRGLVE